MFAYTKLMQAMSGAAAVVSDAFFNLVTLLLNTTATNGAQNNTFLDSSTNNFTITRNGNTTQGTFTPFSQTGWSNYQSAVDANYLNFTTSAGTLFQFAGDFTIEAWVCLATAANGASIWVTNDGSANYFALNLAATNFDIYLNSSSSTNTIPHGLVIGQWAHVAMVRSGSTITLYTNGVSKGTITNSSTLGYSSPSIARNGGGGNVGWYLSNLRIVKSAVYTSAFTPPTTSLTNIANTSLLTCQSNRFVDNSSNALVATVTGTPSVQAFSPFAPTAAYSTSVVGGSGYFDGSSDYLSVAANANLAIGTSDFCIEWFYYQTSTQTSATPFCQWGGGQNNWILQYNSSNFVFYYNNGSSSISYSYTPVPNQWTHGCVCRSGSTMSLFLNGVRVNTQSDAFSIANTTGITVGRNPDGAGQDATGYISNARLVVGSSVYNPSSTTLTVPTAPLTAVSGTQFLLSATNSGIFDSTAKNDLETVGNAQVSTTQAKWGTTSMYFDGTGDWLLIPNNQMLNLNADFTIEFWIYLNSTSGEQCIFHNHNSDNNGVFVSVNGGGAGKIRLGAGNGSSFYVLIDSSTAISSSTWAYVACTRSGSTWTVYINGTSVGTATSASNPTFSTSDLIQVGRFTSGAPNALNAYIDDLRITKYARTITASPTAAFPTQ